MCFFKIFRVVLILIGLGLVGGSMYIQSQVDEGKVKIKKAEKAVGQGNALFSLNPVAKEFGKGLTDSAQKKIDEGKDQIGSYTQLADRLKISGIVLALIGVGLFFVRKKR